MSKQTTPIIRFYWRATKRGGAIRAYLTCGKQRTYGGITGCYCTKEEWAQLTPDGSLRNPDTASEIVIALSRMLVDLRLMATAAEMKKELEEYNYNPLAIPTFQDTMKEVLVKYLTKNTPRKTDISAIVDRIMTDGEGKA